jgi:hypothetical protein
MDKTNNLLTVLRESAELLDSLAVSPHADQLREVANGIAFWDGVYPDGMTLAEVSNELLDFHFIIEQLPKVYYAVTNGTLSKHMYKAETVISLFEETVNEACLQAVDEAFEILEAEYAPEGVAIGTYIESLEEKVAALEAALEGKSERQIEADRE